MLGLPRLLVDETYRDWLVVRCNDPVVRSFWQTEYAAYDTRLRNEAIAPIQNKIGAFLANPFIRSILCQNSSTLKIPDVMNKGKVLIVNLSKGNLGTEPAHLLGALLITACAQAAEARRRMPEDERRDFTLYVDEFQNFATGQQRNGGRLDDSGRAHIVRQNGAQRLVQTRNEVGMPLGPRHDDRRQPHGLGAVVHHYLGAVDIRLLTQRLLDLGGTVDLQHAILAADHEEYAIGMQARDIASSIYAGARMRRIRRQPAWRLPAAVPFAEAL